MSAISLERLKLLAPVIAAIAANKPVQVQYTERGKWHDADIHPVGVSFDNLDLQWRVKPDPVFHYEVTASELRAGAPSKISLGDDVVSQELRAVYRTEKAKDRMVEKLKKYYNRVSVVPVLQGEPS